MSTTSTAVRRSPVVLADLLPGEAVRDVLLVLAAAGFVGAMAQVVIPFPWTPVPFTGQTLAVLTAGAALGAPRAVAAMLLYAAAGVIGVPWFADGASGFGGPSFGYILGFVLAAMVVGWLASRGADRSPLRAVPAMLLGTVLIYLIGVPWLMADLDVGLVKALDLGVRPFLGTDALKVLLAAGLLPAAWRLAAR
jgi:biotin transport system substrate-specific component